MEVLFGGGRVNKGTWGEWMKKSFFIEYVFNGCLYAQVSVK